MATSSQAASAAKGPRGPMHFNGVENPYFVFAGIGNADDYGNEAIVVHVAAIRGLSSAQPHFGIEEFANEGLFAPSPVAGGAS